MLPELAVTAMLLIQQPSNWVRLTRSFVCGPFADIAKGLSADEFKENPQWLGRSDENTSLVLFTNPESGSWTAVIYTGNVGCVIAAGSSSSLLNDLQPPQKPAVHH